MLIGVVKHLVKWGGLSFEYEIIMQNGNGETDEWLKCSCHAKIYPVKKRIVSG